MGDHGQIEIYSQGSTHTLYEFCGYDECREVILHRGLAVTQAEIFEVDEFRVHDGTEYVEITVNGTLDESDSCVWCFGCGDFLRHANAGTPCECENPDEDREPMRPLVREEPLGRLELRHWSLRSGMLSTGDETSDLPRLTSGESSEQCLDAGLVCSINPRNGLCTECNKPEDKA
jgi:hypothetical protein